MTSDTISPVPVPRVIVTPPPPPPPLSPFHLSPPPPPHLPAPCGPADTLHDFPAPHSGPDQASRVCNPGRPTPTMKPRRVRFKLESDSCQQTTFNNGSERKTKVSQTVRSDGDVREVGSSADKVCAELSAVITCSDGEARALLPHQDVMETKERLRRILGKFVENTEAKKAGRSECSVINKEKSKVIVPIDNDKNVAHRNKNVSNHDKNDSGSGEVKTEVALKEKSQSDEVLQKRRKSSGSPIRAVVCSPRPHSASSSPFSPNNQGTANPDLIIQQCTSVFSVHTRPYSSDGASRSGQDRRGLINVQLYRLASRHQHQTQWEKHRQDFSVLVTPAEPPAGDSSGDHITEQGVGCSENKVLSVSSRGHKPREDYRPASTVTMVSKDLGSNPQQGDMTPNGFAKMDCTTLQRLGYKSHTSLLTSHEGRGHRSQSAPPRNATSVSFHSTSSGESVDKNGYRLTKAEYRRLTEQVRDVDSIIRNRFRRPATHTKDKVTRLVPVASPEQDRGNWQVELEGNLLPFRVNRWGPVGPKSLQDPQAVSYSTPNKRPLSVHRPRCPNTVTSTSQRPQSTPYPGHRSQHVPDTSYRDLGFSFTSGLSDTHTEDLKDSRGPGVITKSLKDCSAPPSSAKSCRDDSESRPEKKVWRKYVKDSVKPNLNDDVSTTSGIESDGGDCDDMSDEEEEGEDNDDSSDSDSGGFEPSLDDIRRQLPNPQSLFPLRPETLDALHDPSDEQDTENDVLPVYEFKCPLPNHLQEINLRVCAEDRKYWRDSMKSSLSVDTAMQTLMDRLLELEKLQLSTEAWEARKLRGRSRRQERVLLNNNNSSSRASSGRHRDRRYCNLCQQTGCGGGCLDKRQLSAVCEFCRLPQYTVLSQDSLNDQRLPHMRSSDSLNSGDRAPAAPASSSSKPCCSCQRRRGAKLTSLKNHVPSRPKSTNVLSTRARPPSRPRDLRPNSATSLSCTLLKDLDSLTISSQQQAPLNRLLTSRVRNGVLPGKTFSKLSRKNPTSDSMCRRKKTKVLKTSS